MSDQKRRKHKPIQPPSPEQEEKEAQQQQQQQGQSTKSSVFRRLGNRGEQSQQQQRKRGDVCRNFSRTGICPYGDACIFVHTRIPDEQLQPSEMDVKHSFSKPRDDMARKQKAFGNRRVEIEGQTDNQKKQYARSETDSLKKRDKRRETDEQELDEDLELEKKRLELKRQLKQLEDQDKVKSSKSSHSKRRSKSPSSEGEASSSEDSWSRDSDSSQSANDKPKSRKTSKMSKEESVAPREESWPETRKNRKRPHSPEGEKFKYSPRKSPKAVVASAVVKPERHERYQGEKDIERRGSVDKERDMVRGRGANIPLRQTSYGARNERRSLSNDGNRPVQDQQRRIPSEVGAIPSLLNIHISPPEIQSSIRDSGNRPEQFQSRRNDRQQDNRRKWNTDERPGREGRLSSVSTEGDDRFHQRDINKLDERPRERLDDRPGFGPVRRSDDQRRADHMKNVDDRTSRSLENIGLIRDEQQRRYNSPQQRNIQRNIDDRPPPIQRPLNAPQHRDSPLRHQQTYPPRTDDNRTGRPFDSRRGRVPPMRNSPSQHQRPARYDGFQDRRSDDLRSISHSRDPPRARSRQDDDRSVTSSRSRRSDTSRNKPSTVLPSQSATVDGNRKEISNEASSPKRQRERVEKETENDQFGRKPKTEAISSDDGESNDSWDREPSEKALSIKSEKALSVKEEKLQEVSDNQEIVKPTQSGEELLKEDDEKLTEKENECVSRPDSSSLHLLPVSPLQAEDGLEYITSDDDDEEIGSSAKKDKNESIPVDWDVLKAKPKPQVSWSIRERFSPTRFLRTVSFSKTFLGPELVAKIEAKCNEPLNVEEGKGGFEEFKFSHDCAAMHSAAIVEQETRKTILSDLGPFRRALSARDDLRIRRRLCGFGREIGDPVAETDHGLSANTTLLKVSKEFLERRLQQYENKCKDLNAA